MYAYSPGCIDFKQVKKINHKEIEQGIEKIIHNIVKVLLINIFSFKKITNHCIFFEDISFHSYRP